eukprot:SAG11_NODE_9695_length_889_cov_0.964557_2_plen_94_part_00
MLIATPTVRAIVDRTGGRGGGGGGLRAHGLWGVCGGGGGGGGGAARARLVACVQRRHERLLLRLAGIWHAGMHQQLGYFTQVGPSMLRGLLRV